MAALVGASVGVLTGLIVEKKMRGDGNGISGDVAVHLLNSELLTNQTGGAPARRGGPAEIDVHRVQAPHLGAQAFAKRFSGRKGRSLRARGLQAAVAALSNRST
jgi:hypothetical protein